MASGQVVGLIYQVIPPAATYATPSRRAGGSTPAENFPVWLFDPGTAEHLDFYGQMTGAYSGGGITVQIKWSADATSGNCEWQAAFRRVADDAEDVDVSHTYDFNSLIVTPASVAGEVKYSAITFTNGADMDSVVAGDMFVLRIKRDAADVTNDTMTGDAQLHYIVIQET